MKVQKNPQNIAKIWNLIRITVSIKSRTGGVACLPIPHYCQNIRRYDLCLVSAVGWNALTTDYSAAVNWKERFIRRFYHAVAAYAFWDQRCNSENIEKLQFEPINNGCLYAGGVQEIKSIRCKAIKFRTMTSGRVDSWYGVTYIWGCCRCSPITAQICPCI